MYGKFLKNLMVFYILLSIVVFSAAKANAAGPITTYYPVEYTGILNNPYMGYAPNAQSNSPQPHRLVYIVTTWSELEPVKGIIDFNSFESKNRFSYWKSKGVNAILRIVLDQPEDYVHKDIPDWLYNETGGDGTWYDIDSVKGYSPNYNNSTLIEYHRILISRLASRYNSDPFISQIALGSIGHWGEFHTKRNENLIIPFPTLDVVEQYVKHYVDFFPSKFLLMRRPHQIALNNKMGLYNDVFGDSYSTQRWYDWINNGYTFWLTNEPMPSMPDFWKYAPSGGEIANYPGLQYLESSAMASTINQATYSHTSWLGPSCPANQPIGNTLQNNIDTLLKTIGYRFVLQSETYPSSISPGETLPVSMTWNNKGTAPFYYKWPFEISISDSNGNIVTQRNTTQDIRTWLPGTKSISHNILIPSNLAEGKYKFCVGIINPDTGIPGIDLAIEGKRTDGRYELGEFIVMYSPTPTSTPTATIKVIPTVTATIKATYTATPTKKATPTATTRVTPTVTATIKATYTTTPTAVLTVTPTIKSTPTATVTSTPTFKTTATATKTPTPTVKVSASFTATNNPNPESDIKRFYTFMSKIENTRSNTLPDIEKVDLLNDYSTECLSLIDSSLSKEKVAGMVKSYINVYGKVNLKALPVEHELTIRGNLSKIIEKLIYKFGNFTIRPFETANSGNISFKFYNSESNLVIDNANSIKSILELLNNECETAKIPINIHNKIFLTLDSSGNSNNTDNLDFEIPLYLIAELNKTGIDMISIYSDISNFIIPTDFIGNPSFDTLHIKLLRSKQQELTLIKFNVESITGNITSQIPVFENKVIISVPYSTLSYTDINLLTTFYEKSPGSLVNIGSNFNSISGYYKFRTDSSGTFYIKKNDSRFQDIKKGFWAENFIYTYKAKGIVDGKGSKSTFRPNDSITRAEFAKLIISALGLLDKDAEVSFKDVPSSAWYYRYIASAVKNNIFSGRPDGTFAPNKPVSRQDLAVVTANVLRNTFKPGTISGLESNITFDDSTKISKYAKTSVALNIRYEIIKGLGNNKFQPKNNATRAQAVTILYKLLNYIEE